MSTNVIITAYCACSICCGPNASGLAANGKAPIEGITVAASRRIPLGTKVAVTVNNAFTNRVFIVQDRLAKRYDDRVDLFFDDHKRARQFGKQTGSYTVIYGEQ